MPTPSLPGWEPAGPVLDGSSLEAGSADGSGVYQATSPSKPSGGQFPVFKPGMTTVSVKSLVNDPTDNTPLLAAGDQFGVAISTNQGGAWSPQTLPSQCGTVAGFVYNSHASPGIAFLLCQGVQGVFVGNLNGTSWTLQPCTGLPTPPTFSSGMAIQSGTPDTLYLPSTTVTAQPLFWSGAPDATSEQP